MIMTWPLSPRVNRHDCGPRQSLEREFDGVGGFLNGGGNPIIPLSRFPRPALIYNVLGVPIAAGVLYPAFGILLSPMLAAAAMSLSSISVIGNALRLRRMDLSDDAPRSVIAARTSP
jgi:hypothetical protein